MAKQRVKRYWIVYENNEKVIKHLTFKEKEKHKLATKFFWDNPDSAERYKNYLNTRNT